ncbi:MAG: hypothetical protein ACE5R4_14425 [Armatimonadota bacterium]
MALVTERASAPSGPAYDRRLAWTLRLLLTVLVVQILGWATLLLVIKPELLHPATMRRVEVVEPRGRSRPSAPRHVVITSEMTFYYNDVKQNYKPEDESDAIEYACNLLEQDPRATVRIERLVRVRAGRR